MSGQEPNDSLYLPVVHDVILRLTIAEDALARVESDPDSPLAQGAFETCVLQIRLICELILLGAASAHLHDGGLEVSDTKWRPKHVYYELSKFSDHPLPIPAEIELNKKGPNHHHATPLSGPVTMESLSRIYGICGDFLHVGTIRQVINGSLPTIDLDKISQWLDDFKSLIKGHVLMLPERQIVLICTWSGQFDEQPLTFRMAAQGPSKHDLNALPDFDMLR